MLGPRHIKVPNILTHLDISAQEMLRYLGLSAHDKIMQFQRLGATSFTPKSFSHQPQIAYIETVPYVWKSLWRAMFLSEKISLHEVTFFLWAFGNHLSRIPEKRVLKWS
jgi:hypothetical protein